MPRTRPRATENESEALISEIKTFYQTGREACDALDDTSRHSTISGLAERLGWKPARLYKAVQFARLYSPQQARDLCREMRKSPCRFGTSHLGVLLTVQNEKLRAKLQTACIAGGWSKRELQDRILVRQPSDRPRGRYPKVSHEPKVLLQQVDALAATWQRWYTTACAERPHTNRENFLEKLPAEVIEQVQRVNVAVGRLRKVAAAKLSRPRSEG